jgi:hypothetical protein
MRRSVHNNGWSVFGALYCKLFIMKQTMMSLLLILGVTLGVSAQEKVKVKEQDVPANVQTALKNAYPEAKDIEWKLKDGIYKASFEINGTEHFAGITNAGEVKVKGSEIPADQLPSSISSAIKSSYAKWKIDDVFKVEEGTNISYLVELDGSPDKHVHYSADGKLVKESEDEG